MIRNKKGMTLIEIIISIVLISIILIFLFSLLIKVNEMNKESKINSTYLINKALIIKNIEEDIVNVTKITIESECEINAFYGNYNISVLEETYKKNACLKLIYDEKNDTPAYLGIYYYKSKGSYVISYIHGNIKATRLLPDYSGTPSINISSSNSFHKIEIPLFGPDGKDYSILISYYGTLEQKK